mmetsp:Transcript_37128/g.68767  ORF Transcript_37128/g.68767 Transcript_37128/m.68767 type:complete len:635 (-) Transcript_37128:532-2436(-)|eukprot:CAMPEP_0196135094 /NCGR_PEP_ID=MMETSP0910-20130528/3841_1 /TAXON_ID=49265 /ORGANISM="Thalassiosira rotula, Strain GSO102" /LENGTH=634 /DNA_ID=CAMNT_0041395179 /DNA_START=49 /DNA_END=1956 /DNA_ORIENTATION=-
MSNRRRTRNSGNGNPETETAADEGLQAMRERNRVVAEREASRLARPDQPATSNTFGHAPKGKSAVMSTPFGQMFGGRTPLGTKPDMVVEEEWCGPFSVARQMIAAREDARRIREEQQAEDDPNSSKGSHPLDGLMEIALEKKRRLENPSMNWVSRHQRSSNDVSNANYYAKRRKRFNQQKNLMGNGVNYVPSLFQLCVNYLVENFEHIETLGLVDHSIRRALCERLVAQGKMNGAAFDVLAEMGVETLELVDCAQVTQDQFCDALRVLLPSGLRAILLKHCGRCFGSQAVQVITEINSDELELFAISLAGAYLLKDEDVARLIGAASRTLSSIDLTACPLIGPQFCQALGEHFSSSVGDGFTGCLLELSLQNIPLTKEALLTLGASSDALSNLKSLKLKEIDTVDDEVVSIILNSIEGGSLEGIDLSGNPQLTDEILSCIRRCNGSGNLRALQLSGLTSLTAIGLEAFFTHIDDLPSPPMLRKLDLSQCSYNEVNDAVLTLAAKAASFKRSSTYAANEEDNPNPETLVSDVSGARKGLVHISIIGTSVSDKSMETLAATCSSSLEELDISFCVNVSDKGLGYLVSKLGCQFTKLHVWGLAQLTEEFLDGHDRVEEGVLEIVGVWMKKSGGRSLR